MSASDDDPHEDCALAVGSDMEPSKYSTEYHYDDPDPVERMKAYYCGRQEVVWLLDQFPWMALGSVLCPACGFPPRLRIIQCVVHLNDAHQWSREQVSRWLEEEVQE